MLSSSGLGLGLAQRPSPSLISFSRPPSRPSSARPNSSPRHNMAGLSLSVPRSRLPRSLNRILGIALLLALAVFTLNLSRAPPSLGVWDASSSVDRSDHSLGLALFRRFWKPRKPSWLRDASKTPNYLSHGPNLSRLNRTAPRRTSRGVSRISVPGSNPEEFVTGSLPTIEEAFARLHPRLREIKELVPKIPREHELWSPLFPPFLTKDQMERFKHLKAEWDEDEEQWVEVERRWYLVTVCRQVAGMLADWFSMWTVLADFLGPESLVFSLLEGGSDDGSGELLAMAMRDHLLFIGVPPANIHVRTLLPPVDWEQHHRIELLADMRNAGMKPFYDTLPAGLSSDGKPWTGIIWYNDVYLSASHFLEIMHQHMSQGADMTCGWDHAGKWFYDGWVGRDMAGDLYTPFPVREEDQDLPQKLFPSSPRTKDRHNRLLPYQVFAGWNGIALMRPDPFLPPYNVRFRRGAPTNLPPDAPHNAILSSEVECQASESAFISWDFWKYGFGRIMVVPGVHATYGKDDARIRGWLEFPNPEEPDWPEQVEWDDEPPRKVRCHDWPDKPGKGWWAWDTVRWVDPPALVIPEGADDKPHPATPSDEAAGPDEMGDAADDERGEKAFNPFAD